MPADAVTALPDAPGPDAPGFYGKLPARGDFVGRRLSRNFIDAWDGWLQQAILASREALGRTWLEIYLTSPLWRFALRRGACGPAAVAGVMMPSVDSVGRYYPLLLGRELDGDVDPSPFLAAAAPWFQALEDLAIATLSDGFELATLDRPLPLPAAPVPRPRGGPPPSPGIHVALDGDASGIAKDAEGAMTAWQTLGSERVAASLLVCPAMPPPEAFAALLDGDWTARGWVSEDRAVPVAPESAADDGPAWDREE